MEQSCIFCKIAAGEVPGEFVYRDDQVFVIRDIAPKAPVHLLVIPIGHVEARPTLGPTTAPCLGQCSTRGRNARGARASRKAATAW